MYDTYLILSKWECSSSKWDILGMPTSSEHQDKTLMVCNLAVLFIGSIHTMRWQQIIFSCSHYRCGSFVHVIGVIVVAVQEYRLEACVDMHATTWPNQNKDVVLTLPVYVSHHKDKTASRPSSCKGNSHPDKTVSLCWIGPLLLYTVVITNVLGTSAIYKIKMSFYSK